MGKSCTNNKISSPRETKNREDILANIKCILHPKFHFFCGTFPQILLQLVTRSYLPGGDCLLTKIS